MKLIAYDLFNVVVIENNGVITAHYKKGGANQINDMIAKRLGLIGFKEVSIDIASVNDAWVIAETEANKTFPS